MATARSPFFLLYKQLKRTNSDRSREAPHQWCRVGSG